MPVLEVPVATVARVLAVGDHSLGLFLAHEALLLWYTEGPAISANAIIGHEVPTGLNASVFFSSGAIIGHGSLGSVKRSLINPSEL